MLATAVVVALASLAAASLALFMFGHRVRRSSMFASLLLATFGTVVTGEIAARVFQLQSAAVLGAEMALVGAAFSSPQQGVHGTRSVFGSSRA